MPELNVKATEEDRPQPTFISINRQRELIQDNPDLKTDQDKSDYLDLLVSRGHELEGLNAKFEPTKALTNIPESAKELGMSFVNLFTKNKDTGEWNAIAGARGLSKAGLGLLEKVVPGKQSHEDAFNALADATVERYGSIDRILNTVEKDPVGFLSDFATAATLGGAGLGGGAKLLAKAGATGTKASAVLARTAETLNYAGKIADPVNIAAKTGLKAASLLEGQVASKTIERINDFRIRRLLDKTDVNEQMLEGLDIRGAQREKLSTKLKTLKAGEKLAQLGVTGTLSEMSEQLAEIGSKSKLKLDKSLEAIPDRIKAPVTEKIIYDIADLKTKVPFSKMSEKAQEAYTSLVDLYRKNRGDGLTLSELNEIKRGMYEIVDDRAFQNPATPAISQAKKNAKQLYTEVQDLIEVEAGKRGFKDVKELNRQTQFANEFKKIIDSKIARGGDKVAKSKLLTEHTNNIIHQAVINQSKLGQITALTKMFFQVSRSPQFKRDMATAVQLLTDGEFKKLAGGIKYARKQTEAEGKLLGRQAKLQANRQAQQVIDKIVQDLSKAYPVLRGLRVAGYANAKIDEEGRIRMPEQVITGSTQP